MMPPTSIDGTDITGATIDGTDVQEITVDGQTVFAAAPDIPASGDLHARYDATQLSLSDGSPVSTWNDETGNGHDLTAGNAPTFKTNIIGGKPVVRFDGVNDRIDVSFTALPQPNTIYAVFQLTSTSTGNDNMWGTTSTGARHDFIENLDGNFSINGGSFVIDGSSDTSEHIVGAFYDSTNSKIRLDGSQVASGDAGTDSMGGYRLGDGSFTGNNQDVDFGEILIYPQDKSSIQRDIEKYLSAKWGISV